MEIKFPCHICESKKISFGVLGNVRHGSGQAGQPGIATISPTPEFSPLWSESQDMAPKRSLGRQKIKIAQIQKKSDLQVTFSKRRVGLFKKASELCTLCGVEIAIIVFSPARKVYSFGHPKVESIVDRLLTRNPNLNSTNLHLVEAHMIASIPDLNVQQTHMRDELEAEKKRSQTLDEMRKASQSQFWWEAPIEDLNLSELEQLKDSMEELKKTIVIQANKLFLENSSSVPNFGTNYNDTISGDGDYCEMKPDPIISASFASSHVHSYGYGHGDCTTMITLKYKDSTSIVSQNMAPKRSLGRQKIKNEKIQIKNHLQVTFSKRRTGLLKKASELCTLCGVEIAIIVFSPAGKVYSFGHPNVESIVDRFLTRNLNINSTSLHLVEAHRIATIPDLNIQQTHMSDELEAEKKRSETLDEMRKASQSQFWWESPIEDLNLNELEQLKESMDELKKTLDVQANKLFVQNSNSVSFFGTSNGTRGGVDHYEMKSTPVISPSSGSSQVHSYGYGYGHGLF
ncbi:hypothetical protein LXL04_012596 [Taraxacum kok-saghyz]